MEKQNVIGNTGVSAAYLSKYKMLPNGQHCCTAKKINEVSDGVNSRTGRIMSLI